MTTSNKDLLLLFDRPKEPLFTAKGDNDQVFQIPENYLKNRFKPIANQLANRFGEGKGKIPVKNINVPDLTEIIEGLGRFDNFSAFIPKHGRLAGQLIAHLLDAKDAEDLKSIAVYARQNVNPYLFNYAYSVALLHRSDTNNLDLPSHVTSFPDKFVDPTTLQKARAELSVVPADSRMRIIIPRDFTATDAEPEHRLAYFREDIGVNLHHWHWKLIYPFMGPERVVRKDRRGELFYYMHEQIVARYNFERLCNGLARVERLIDFNKPIDVGYFPKLDGLISGRKWPGRVANLKLQDVNRGLEQMSVKLSDMERYRQRIYEAIHSGTYQTSGGQTMPLTEFEGIDILGHMVESVAALTPNGPYYGSFHNMGHMLMGYINDPDGRHLEGFGVILDGATAMRDPMFYRWHASLDDIFQEHKQTLPPYSNPQLNFQGIQVNSITIESPNNPVNQLNTYWMQSDLNLARGMDFSPRGSVFVRFTHLNHKDFTYKIEVTNQGGPITGTCRIFVSPKNDESGRTMLFRDQRLMMVELDRFTVSLRQGMNTITRRSTDSSVTIPLDRVYRDIGDSRPADSDTQNLDQFNFCGCGWPHNMLIPRGTPEGAPSELFIMITDYENDKVNQTTEGQCNDAYSFCGLKDKMYPDRRPMGFPFDRMPPVGIDTLTQFLTANMKVQDITIRFDNTSP